MHIGISIKINNRMTNSVDPDEKARLSGSALFAKVFILVSRDERLTLSLSTNHNSSRTILTYVLFNVFFFL